MKTRPTTKRAGPWVPVRYLDDIHQRARLNRCLDVVIPLAALAAIAGVTWMLFDCICDC